MKTTRRSFLAAAPALAAAGAVRQPAPALVAADPRFAWDPASAGFPAVRDSAASSSPAPRDSSYDPWVEIHPGNLRHNIEEIRKRVGGRPILAVIKNNGYGLGVVNVARLLEPLPAVAGVTVIKLREAMALRDAGFHRPILVMGPTDEGELEEAASRESRLDGLTGVARRG